MDASKVTIQQLLRPTETCIYVTSGTMMGARENEHCELAVVRHEGTQEHALFVFQADSMGQLQADQLLPITGPFDVSMQYSVSTHTVVEILSSKGTSVVYQLPYTATTAMLFSVVKHAKEGLANSTSANSPFSFLWLQGYQACRTGWDRFSKPHQRAASGSHLIDFGDSWSSEEGAGLPEKWPWSHIFTPNPDGETASAKCESLVQEFDPLLQQPLNDPAPRPTNPVPIKSSPDKPHPLSSTLLPPAPLTAQQLLGNSMRPCSSETNLSYLRNEVHTRDPTMFHSQENLQHVVSEEKRNHRQCCIADSEVYIHNAVPSQRPQASEDRAEESDNEEELDNPFQEKQEEVGSPRHDRHISPPEDDGIELKRVKEDGVLPSRPVTIATPAVSSSPGASSLDYNFRRMRSSTAIPQSSSSTFYIDTPPLDVPFKLGDKLRQPTVQTTMAASHSPKLSRRKPRSETVSVLDSNKSSWVTRYQPGVLLLSGSMRECLIQRKLQESENEFCEQKKLKLFCGTWNVNGQHPMQRMDNFLLSDKRTPDIYAIGFQELDLSTEALLKNESLREDQWISLAVSSLERVVNKTFIKVSSVRLVGILLVVFVESSIVPHITEVETDTVATGILGHLGNKGGVAIRFNIHHSSLCIVNSHLAAHMDEVEKRNQDYHQIYNKLQFFKQSSIPYTIMDHDAVVWMGDLNYRVQVAHDLTPDIIKARVDSFQYSSLLKHDQLHLQKQRGAAFSHFAESEITFKPTYKYDPSTNSWDTSEKHRAPAWCDRVLYHCEGKMLECVDYRSHPEMIISDHKPVSALFDLTVKVVLPEREREVLENITWMLDKQENDTLPQVSLNTLEFTYSDVKFMVPQIQQLVVTNTGQRPVRISFLPTPDKHDCICRPWLVIKPDSKVIMPGEKAVINLTMFVTPELVGDVMKSQNRLEDILVLHLEGGKDFFISVSGNYIQSSFGQSLEKLVQLHVPIREVPTERLIDVSSSFALSSSWAEYDAQAQPTRTSAPPLDIPKELFVLVDYLRKHGLDKENLFTDGGLTAEQEKIRDAVDAGGNDFPGSVQSVAAVLLMFLRALAQPIIPQPLHQRCMDCCNNPTLCKQVLLQMPVVHRRSFVFIVTFLKQLLDHSQENQMDAKILASIFGEVLLSMPHETRRTTNRKSVTQMTKRKALFVYQFLVNNITVNYS